LGQYGIAKGLGSDAGAVRDKKYSAVGHVQAIQDSER
jgi:hypothetical protein